MPDSGLFRLLALPVREVKAECGCALVLVQERLIDAREGHFIAVPAMVVVPCEHEDHVEQMRDAAAAVGVVTGDHNLEEIVATFEETAG